MDGELLSVNDEGIRKNYKKKVGECKRIYRNGFKDRKCCI